MTGLMILLLQIWGGLAYLLNKVCFSRAERSLSAETNRTWRIRSWVAYLAGLPAWVAVFVMEHNWIVAAVESSGAPAMIIGLMISWRGSGSEPKRLDHFARFIIALGLAASIYEFGGIKTPNQCLELGVSAGFLFGTYLLAKDKVQGYLWIMLGNVSCFLLMLSQGYYILMIQQSVSLIFTVDACANRSRRRVENAS